MSEKYLGENSTPLLINQIKENCTQKRSTLPIPSIDELGNTYQYTGTTSGSLVHGYFYECVSDGQNPATYFWSQVNIQPTAGTPTAATTTFDNTTSGLQATNVQDAIDEVEGRVDNIEDKIPSTATSSNKLIDHDSLGTAAFKNSTDRVSPNNTALVESQSVYSAINTALSSIYTPRGDITCAELTSDLLIAANVGNIYETSDSGTTTALFLQGAGVSIPTGSNVGIINAGQGRILFNLMANAFDLTDYQKKDLTQVVEGATTVEGALGALSTNKATQTEVSSVKQALSNEVSTRATLGAHQLFELALAKYKEWNTYGTWNNNVYTINDGTNNLTFTVNSDLSITVNGLNTADRQQFAVMKWSEIPYSDNLIMSGCPSGGSTNTYWMQMTDNTQYSVSDTGNGTSVFNKSSFASNKDIWTYIFVKANTSVTNKTFKPLLKLASDTDTTYRPYVPTNSQLLSADVNAELGAHNLLDPATLEPTTSPSNSGLTFTNNGDGTITVTGTALKTDVFGIAGNSNTLTLSDGSYKIYVKNASRVRVVGRNTGGTWVQLASATGDTAIITASSSYTVYTIQVGYDTGVQYNTTLYPMILDPADPSTKFTPYAMTNRELTEKIDIVGNLFTTTTKVVDNITHGIATTVATLENLPIGTYVVSGQFNSDSAMNGGGLVQFASSGVIQNGATCSTMINQGFKANAGLTGIFSVTNATNRINLQIYTANADLTVVSARLAAIRIA